ncbi:MAG: tRNA (adenosine(37)-N6)-threonylcarbamoyltransferase complex dimerization subunit type 1 TsaB [Ruminococcaceae bacterium]|nr:tRNA (adenosine(37)-N6)-threonylcarbamoyltransferase complex dimerization subunit type 1 TsaB [Oscillospiraceae bacterium]
MKILGVDTSSGVATAAICDDEKLICEFVLNNKMTHSQTLMPIIDMCFKHSELTVNDIDLFAVSEGPGSFTGLRIGVTTVKGLAHGANKPIVGVNTLEAMAYNLPFCPYLISPIMDARRGEVYNGVYRFLEGALTEVKSPRALPVSQLIEELSASGEKVVFLGDGVPVFRSELAEKLGDIAIFAPQSVGMQKASSVCMAAGKKEQMHYSKLSPVYLRKSQAERELEERGKK